MTDWEDAIEEAKQNLGYHSNEYIEDWDSVVEEARDILHYEREEEYNRFCDNAKDDYADYLKSNRWKKLRNQVLWRDNYQCQICKCNATQVHHKSYDRLYTVEEIEDCVSICDKCHKKTHNK